MGRLQGEALPRAGLPLGGFLIARRVGAGHSFREALQAPTPTQRLPGDRGSADWGIERPGARSEDNTRVKGKRPTGRLFTLPLRRVLFREGLSADALARRCRRKLGGKEAASPAGFFADLFPIKIFGTNVPKMRLFLLCLGKFGE